MALPLLKQIRDLVWYSVDNLSALNTGIGKLNGKFSWDDSGATLDPGFAPALGELPALSIYGAAAASPWLSNQQQQIEYALICELWTQELHLTRAELIWQLFLRAVWHDTTGVRRTGVVEDLVATAPAAFNRLPVSDGDETGDVAYMTHCQWALTLKTRWNPRTDTGALTLT